jgi:hypothetical protein
MNPLLHAALLGAIVGGLFQMSISMQGKQDHTNVLLERLVEEVPR